MMSKKLNPALTDPEVRRVFEEEFLVGEATDTLVGLIGSLGITRTELAERLGVSAGRVSQILSGDENLTLRSLAAFGWALGLRFGLEPLPMTDRAGTPAIDDPAAPAWLGRLGMASEPRFERLESVRYEKGEMRRAALRVVGGEVRAA
jgi:transcriptional regulator with XRE-family HTH domain